MVSAGSAAAGDDPWPRDFDKRVARWEEVPLIPNALNGWAGEKAPFFSLNWHVHVENGQVVATAAGHPNDDDDPVVPLQPSINGFESLDDTDWLALPVLNGWIVGVDLGEWGGKVIWYSRDGRKRMEVSSDQIPALIRTADGLFAIGSMASGDLFLQNSLIDIRREPNGT